MAPAQACGLDLGAIEAALREVEACRDTLNHALGLTLEPLEDRVIANLMDGYDWIGQLHRAGVDVFALGHSTHLLELNIRVLCGTDPDERRAFAAHIEATRARFYDHPGGGMGALVEWVKRNRRLDDWSFAAGLYLGVVREPQLFIEGNHRSGFLLMNLELLRRGREPFVLTPATAPALFEITAGLSRCQGARLSLAFEGSTVRQALANLLRTTLG